MWKRTFHALMQLPSLVAGLALLFLMTLTFTDVVLRSVLNNPLVAATELTRIAVAVVVFTTLPMIAARRQQIVVDLLDWFYVDRWARIRDGVIDIVCGLLLYWPVSRIWVLGERALKYGDVTEYLRIPQAYVVFFVLVATVVTAIVLVVGGVLTLLGFETGRRTLGSAIQ